MVSYSRVREKEVINPKQFEDYLSPIADQIFEYALNELRTKYPRTHTDDLMKLAFRVVHRVKIYRQSIIKDDIEKTHKVQSIKSKYLRHPYTYKNAGIASYATHPEESYEREEAPKEGEVYYESDKTSLPGM
jgi:hypothetical protein